MPAFHCVSLNATRLVLRRLREADAPVIFEIFSDPNVTRYWSRPALTEVGQASAYIHSIQEGYAEGSVLQLGLERKEDGLLLGTCTLFHLDWSNRRGEIGYALAHRHWGQGWMHEALQVLIRYAFEELDLQRLEADIDPRNLTSARSLERLGFLREGLLRERWIVDGEVSDTGFYGLLRREWQAGLSQ